ncbi:GNAT family N-acetyltransferase [Arthrobacter sp. L77]|uniref:GNAT family N-acetyltransferase n=1 Tax=Arthrobacter sp. L77 TaxID=1496689 RepID=UPI00068A58F1|nr:N-acetyltransferase [Arthrobacter sp. L77]
MSVDPLPPTSGPADRPAPGTWADVLDFPDPAAREAPDAGTPEAPRDLSSVSTRQLRILCNELYRALDADFPAYGVLDDYAAVVAAITDRESRAAERAEAEQLREKFRDNPAASRFELFHDGVLVGYVKYDLRAGRLRLLQTVVGSAHHRQGLEPVLVRKALLNAHRRRLAPVPYCAHAQAFLTENPHFQALIPVD